MLTGKREETTLLASGRDQNGAALMGLTFTWTSSDESIVTVSTSGVVTAIGEGTATVTASAGNVSGSASVDVRFRWSIVAPGSRHTCGLRGRQAYCWGTPTTGRLTDPGGDDELLIPTAVDTDLAFVDLDVGDRHACGLTEDGTMYCWGQNRFGQLGNGSVAETSIPTPVLGGLTFTAVSLGNYHTCGLTPEGLAYCWGGGSVAGKDLAVGYEPWDVCEGSSYFSPRCTKSPWPVSGGLTFSQISAGLFHTCGLTDSGAAHCWGWNQGMLGNGEWSGSGGPWGFSTPVPVAGGHTFAQVSAGNLHSCGVTTTGPVLCWGAYAFNRGQLGTGRFDLELEPAPVADLTDAARVDASKENNINAANTCGLTGNGAAFCWGSNSDGQLGTDVGMEECTTSSGPVPCSSRPVAVSGGLSFASVETGNLFACGVTLEGEAYCWGRNGSGQLGNGTRNDATLPTKVLDPT